MAIYRNAAIPNWTRSAVSPPTDELPAPSIPYPRTVAQLHVCCLNCRAETHGPHQHCTHCPYCQRPLWPYWNEDLEV
jgi:hypothetical protein